MPEWNLCITNNMQAPFAVTGHKLSEQLNEILVAQLAERFLSY